MKNNIVLVGMMGSGKSTLSHLLYKKTGYKVVDTDDLIEQSEKRLIKDIFKNNGEGYFRKLESDLLKEMRYKGHIISTGGGMILTAENRELLKSMGHVFYLNGSVETLYDRLVHGTENRPLLSGDELKKQINDLLVKRHELYLDSADYVIDINLKSAEDVISEIYTILKDLDYKFLP